MFATSALRIANAIAGAELQERGALSRTLDSIVFPWSVREQQDEPRVRPARAVLFRIAIALAIRSADVANIISSSIPR